MGLVSGSLGFSSSSAGSYAEVASSYDGTSSGSSTSPGVGSYIETTADADMAEVVVTDEPAAEVPPTVEQLEELTLQAAMDTSEGEITQKQEAAILTQTKGHAVPGWVAAAATACICTFAIGLVLPRSKPQTSDLSGSNGPSLMPLAPSASAGPTATSL